MIHPSTRLVHISEDMGMGLVATERIAAGTLTWVMDVLDQTLSPELVAGLPRQFASLKTHFAYRNARGDYILTWDHARFMNHSCDHNCALSPYGFEIAVRDIEAGEQLFNDYAMLNLEDWERLDCCCGAPQCRREITGLDAQRMAPQWELQIARALEQHRQVAQPLMSLLPGEQFKQALAHYGRVGAA